MNETADPVELVRNAIAAQQAGDPLQAETRYRQALATAPGFTVARFNLGHLLLQDGRVAEAAELLAQALAEDPVNPLRAMTARALGLALHQRGWWEAARPWLQEAVLEHPNDSELEQACHRSRPPSWLEPEVFDPGLGTTLHRAAPREADTYIYTIDVVGTCNLRCPSCPVGNMLDSERPRGFMDRATFVAILDKIRRESPAQTPQLWLYNWGEPLLHPELPEFIEAARERGLPVHLSSNLNLHQPMLERIIAAAPAELKISISGFSQATYKVTHRRGRLDRVVENLHAIRRWLDHYASDTRVWVGQHVYRSNQHEVAALGTLCAQLGFAHHPIAAFFQPLEKLIRLAEGEALDAPVLDDLLEHPSSYIQRFARVRDRSYDCELRANQTVINHDGSVALCCMVYEPENQLGVKFIDTPKAALDDLKYQHATCTRCQRLGLAYAPSVPNDLRSRSE